MITIVVAMDLNQAIGITGGEMPWGRTLKDDLRHFQKLTTGHTVVMGRKTLEAIGGPLPERRNVVLSRRKTYYVSGAETVNSWEWAKQSTGELPCFVIGGAEIYKAALPDTEEIYLTLVHHEFDADVKFPTFDGTQWVTVSAEHYKEGERNRYPFTIMHLLRR